MELLTRAALWIHILSGSSALIAGILAILSAKGRKLHIRSGMLFYYSMLAVSWSAIFISIVKPNEFLLMIGIFALYMNISGKRSVVHKRLEPRRLDWVLLAIASVNSILMLASMNIILMVFGLINASLVFTDARIYYRIHYRLPLPKNAWLKRHIGMMMGTYISTFTAFIVVNVSHFEPFWLPWLLPTALGLPLLAYFTKKHTAIRKTHEI